MHAAGFGMTSQGLTACESCKPGKTTHRSSKLNLTAPMAFWLPAPPPRCARPCLLCKVALTLSRPQGRATSASLPSLNAQSSHEARRVAAVAAAAPRAPPAASVHPRENHKIFDEVSLVVRHASAGAFPACLCRCCWQGPLTRIAYSCQAWLDQRFTLSRSCSTSTCSSRV